MALANQELLRLDKLRQDLTSMVVHDMKGLLAEVMGNLDLMGYDPLTERPSARPWPSWAPRTSCA